MSTHAATNLTCAQIFEAFATIMAEYSRRPLSLKPWDMFYFLPSEKNR